MKIKKAGGKPSERSTKVPVKLFESKELESKVSLQADSDAFLTRP